MVCLKIWKFRNEAHGCLILNNGKLFSELSCSVDEHGHTSDLMVSIIYYDKIIVRAKPIKHRRHAVYVQDFAVGITCD